MKKFLAIFLMCCMLVPLFVGCNTGSDGGASKTDSTTDSNAGDEGTITPELILIEGGKTEYKIIRPEKCQDYLLTAMTEFRNVVKEKYGITFSPSDDWVRDLKDGQYYESDAPEILIGATNRKESQEVLATLERGEYKICVVGNKLVMVGYNDYLTSLAINDFINENLSKADSEKLALAGDFSISEKSMTETIGNSDATVRIMTFNVLGNGSEYLKRIPCIVKTIEIYSPDVIGFQECNKDQHNNMLVRLTDYEIAYKTHDGSNTVVYTPILYRKDKFTLIDAGAEWLDSRYTKTNTKSLSWAVLEDKMTGDKFGVINIHGALWSTDYELPTGMTHAEMTAIANTQWKEDNMRQMNDRMQAMITEYGDIPVLWTGDYNYNSDNSAYQKVTQDYGMKDAEHSATDKKDEGIKTYHNEVGVKPSPETGLSIDHIFGNSKVTFRLHNVCNDSQDEISASDHFAVIADVKFN